MCLGSLLSDADGNSQQAFLCRGDCPGLGVETVRVRV